MPEQGARGCFEISLGILSLEHQNRTIPWWAQGAALSRAANTIMKRGNQDRAELPNPGSLPDPGSPTGPELGAGEGRTAPLYTWVPFSLTQSVSWASRLCVEMDRGCYILLRGKGEGWAFIISRILQYLECSYFLGYHRSQNSIQISSAWTLIFPIFHWHHIKSVSQSTQTLRLSDNLGGLLNLLPEGLYHVEVGNFLSQAQSWIYLLKNGKRAASFTFPVRLTWGSG